MAIRDCILAKISKSANANDENSDKSNNLKLKIWIDASIDNCFNHMWPLHNTSKGSEEPCGVQNVSSPCDVIGDVITIKNTVSKLICNDLFISDVKLNLSKICKRWINKSDEILRSRRTFLSEVSTKVECAISIVSPISYILRFWSTL